MVVRCECISILAAPNTLVKQAIPYPALPTSEAKGAKSAEHLGTAEEAAKNPGTAFFRG